MGDLSENPGFIRNCVLQFERIIKIITRPVPKCVAIGTPQILSTAYGVEDLDGVAYHGKSPKGGSALKLI
jgi:hypothetical protein